MLATSETLSAGAPSALGATPSSSNIALSWTAASGASKYRIERKGAGESYGLLTTTTSTSNTDSGASSGSAYLYRVCAADSGGNCTSDYSNIALGARLNFTTDATIVSYSDDPATATTIKAAHITELRTAVNAVRSLAGLSSATWTNTTLTAQSSVISADDVRDLRTKLDDGLTTLGIQTSSYTDSTLSTGSSGTAVKKVHITELRTRATSGAGNSTSGGSSGGLHYMLSDLQGTTRAVMNNSGSGSSVIARHDYLPFGEEIGASLRTAGQGYNASDTNRWKYGLTERDASSGLDHTWWRKYESTAGRWTSPDPLNGSATIAEPQSFNRYSYTQNDPANFVDPSGLDGLPYIGGFGIGPPVYFVNSLPGSAPSGTGHSNTGFIGGGEGMHGTLLDTGVEQGQDSQLGQTTLQQSPKKQTVNPIPVIKKTYEQIKTVVKPLNDLGCQYFHNSRFVQNYYYWVQPTTVWFHGLHCAVTSSF